MAPGVMTISNRNHGAWALRGWMLARLAGLKFMVKVVACDDADLRDELQLLSGIQVPSLQHRGVTIWDTLAIGEYLHEIKPEAQLYGWPYLFGLRRLLPAHHGLARGEGMGGCGEEGNRFHG